MEHEEVGGVISQERGDGSALEQSTIGDLVTRIGLTVEGNLMDVEIAVRAWFAPIGIVHKLNRNLVHAQTEVARQRDVLCLSGRMGRGGAQRTPDLLAIDGDDEMRISLPMSLLSFTVITFLWV